MNSLPLDVQRQLTIFFDTPTLLSWCQVNHHNASMEGTLLRQALRNLQSYDGRLFVRLCQMFGLDDVLPFLKKKKWVTNSDQVVQLVCALHTRIDFGRTFTTLNRLAIDFCPFTALWGEGNIRLVLEKLKFVIQSVCGPQVQAPIHTLDLLLLHWQRHHRQIQFPIDNDWGNQEWVDHFLRTGQVWNRENDPLQCHTLSPDLFPIPPPRPRPRLALPILVNPHSVRNLSVEFR